MTTAKMGRWARRLTVLGALVALSFSAGCERDDLSRTVREDRMSAETGTQTGPDGLGASCAHSEDCNSYLRCFDGSCQVPPALRGEQDESTPRLTFVDEGGGKVAAFYLELAVGDAEQRKGLMFRREMPDEWGMLFVYDDQAQRSFWMQNTFIALDMIFVDADGRIVHIIEQAEPLTRVGRKSREPARYVLEINGGLADELGLAVGQTMRLANVAPEHQPGE